MSDLTIQARKLAADLAEGHYAMGDAINMIDRLVIEAELIKPLQALADELATFLTDEEHGSDGMSGDDGASNLGAFIQQARGLSDCRPLHHAVDCDCGECPKREENDCGCADRAPADGSAWRCPDCDADWPEVTTETA